MVRGRTAGTVGLAHVPFPEYPNVITIAEGVGEGPRESRWHSHTEAEINVMLDGHGVWRTREVTVEVSVGDAFLLRPETEHFALWPAGVRFKTGTVDFGLGVQSKSLLGFYGSGPEPGPPRAKVTAWLLDSVLRKPFHHLRWDGFPDWWRRLYSEKEAAGGPYRALRVESALLEVLSRFADPAFGQNAGEEQGERRGIDLAMRHISEKIVAQGPVAVAELAHVAGMSRSKFAELFRHYVGMPPHAYATALRIWMAQSALASSRATAAMIASQLGFSSAQHFSRSFKTATGLTPQDYRRRWAVPWLKEE